MMLNWIRNRFRRSTEYPPYVPALAMSLRNSPHVIAPLPEESVDLEVMQHDNSFTVVYASRPDEIIIEDLQSLDDVYGVIRSQWGYDADTLEWRPITVNVVAKEQA